MILQGDIKKWITDTLKDDTDYEQLCIDTIGEPLNFYRSSPMDRNAEDLPYLTAYSDMMEADETSQKFFKEEWFIPVSISIEESDDPIDDNEVNTWTSTDKVEKIAYNAIETLKKESRACGINGEDILLVSYSIYITEIGEANDTQAIIQLQFGKVNNI